VSSGERFLAAGGSSDQSEFTDVLPKPNRTEASPFPQSCRPVAPMPTEMADCRGAWRYAGESWPSDDRPKGAPPYWNPSRPPETTHTDGDGAEPLDRVSTWSAAMARQCAGLFRPDQTDAGGSIFTRAHTCDRKEGMRAREGGELRCGAGHVEPNMAELR
jgi:hypothetical protein